MFDHRRSQSVPIGELPNSSGMEYLPTSFLETDGNSSARKTVDVMMTSSAASEVVTSTNSTSGVAGNGANGGGSNDDLDLTLSALKDCDKDFSKFVQEVENNGTK